VIPYAVGVDIACRMKLTVYDTYSKRAMARRSNLPKELKHLAWLTLDEEDGQEYWNAMNLMGRYAAANHELIHKQQRHPLRHGRTVRPRRSAWPI
jgi:RNA-splicing ligase RtcB